jgi:hypothetical protein
MFGLSILARTLSIPTRKDSNGNRWQYHSRSDHHSKVACYGIVFDLLIHNTLLREQIAAGNVFFGINHEMRDFVQDRKKNLDLVLCTKASSDNKKLGITFASMAKDYQIALTDEEQHELDALPLLHVAPVGSVLVALEAKACMTAHQRALPRLYDELNSSHSTVHGASDMAIAAGFTMVNISERYLSPDLNKANPRQTLNWSVHNQPRDAGLAIEKIKQLPRRSKSGERGYDALAIVVVNCDNGGSEVRIHEGAPAPKPGEIYHYAAMIDRLSHLYTARFREFF